MKRLILLMLMALTLTPLTGIAATPIAGTPIDPANFSTEVTNPLFPLQRGNVRIYEGTETNDDGEEVSLRVEELVLAETKTVGGVEVVVLEVNEYENGELIEHTLDYHAQAADGAVWYFGEDVDNYEDGVIVDHEGSWLAGEGENKPGLFMPVAPAVGDEFAQEQAPGIAEDLSTVVEVDLALSTAVGDFTGCIKTDDFNPLDGKRENKFYCPGVGLVREEAEGVLVELVEFKPAPEGTPAA